VADRDRQRNEQAERQGRRRNEQAERQGRRRNEQAERQRDRETEIIRWLQTEIDRGMNRQRDKGGGGMNRQRDRETERQRSFVLNPFFNYLASHLAI
jgi:hypothetical protein